MRDGVAHPAGVGRLGRGVQHLARFQGNLAAGRVYLEGGGGLPGQGVGRKDVVLPRRVAGHRLARVEAVLFDVPHRASGAGVGDRPADLAAVAVVHAVGDGGLAGVESYEVQRPAAVTDPGGNHGVVAGADV